jgi:hypothetical protein
LKYRKKKQNKRRHRNRRRNYDFSDDWDSAFYLIAGRFREIHPLMFVLGVVSMGLIWLKHGKF